MALIEQRGRSRRLVVGPRNGPLRVVRRCYGRHPETPYSLLAVAAGTVAEALSCDRARGVYNGARLFRLRDGHSVRVVREPLRTRAIQIAGARGTLAIATQDASLHGPVRVAIVDAGTLTPRFTLDDLPEPSTRTITPMTTTTTVCRCPSCEAGGAIWLLASAPATASTTTIRYGDANKPPTRNAYPPNRSYRRSEHRQAVPPAWRY